MAKILVTGDRNWGDKILADKLVRRLRRRYGTDLTILIGDCKTGVDDVVARMARRYGVRVERFIADWDYWGKRAGPERNARMIAARPDFVVACHKDLSRSLGTRDCCTQALRAGIPVYHVDNREADPRRLHKLPDRPARRHYTYA